MRWFCESVDILLSCSLKLAKFVDFVELLDLGLCAGLRLFLSIYHGDFSTCFRSGDEGPLLAVT